MGLIKPKGEKKISIRVIGLVMLIIGGIGICLSLYLLIFGTKAEAEFTELKPYKSKYINHYVYTANDKEYEYTERVSRDDAGKAGDTVTVRYMPFVPSVTYDSNMLILGGIVFVMGVAAFISSKKDS